MGARQGIPCHPALLPALNQPSAQLAFSLRLPTVLAPVAAGVASQRVALPALRSFSEGGSAAERDPGCRFVGRALGPPY